MNSIGQNFRKSTEVAKKELRNFSYWISHLAGKSNDTDSNAACKRYLKRRRMNKNERRENADRDSKQLNWQIWAEYLIRDFQN